MQNYYLQNNYSRQRQQSNYRQPQQNYLFSQNPQQQQNNQSQLVLQQRASSMALRGQQIIHNSQTQIVLQQNQQKFEDLVRRKQMQSHQQQINLNQMMDNQTMILQNLLQNNYQYNPQPPKQKSPPPRPFEINLKSIMLKPLEYYSQQMSQIQLQQPEPYVYKQNIPPQQQQPKQVDMSRPHGFKDLKPPQRTVEIQTDNQITQFENSSRMGMTSKDIYGQYSQEDNNRQESQWGMSTNQPKEDESVNQMVGNSRYGNGKNWNIQVGQKKKEDGLQQQQQAPVRAKSKALPPGVNRQQRAKQNLKTFKLALSYLLLYWISIIKSIRQKRQAALEQKGALSIQCMQSFVQYFKTTSGKVIQTFTQSKANIFVTDKKKVQEDEMNNRAISLKSQVRKLFLTLVDQFDTTKLAPKSVEFLGTIMNDFEYLPQNFLFIFEINRFEYTSYGALKNMNPERGRMLIITFLFIRVYLFRMIFKPWTDFPDVRKKELLIQNCQQVGTIMYEIAIEYIKDRCYKIGQNQAFLSMDFKNFQRNLGPLVLESYELPEDPQELRILREQEEPLILGMETRDDLKVVMDDKIFTNEMQAYLEEWADSLYDVIQIKYGFLKNERKKKYLVDKITFIQTQFKDDPQEMDEYITQAKKIAKDNTQAKPKFFKK